MPSFHNGAVEIAYLDEGEGPPIVLVHGFASSKDVRWVYPTCYAAAPIGERVIALDHRGHGALSKLYDPEDYHIGTMMGDDARTARSSCDPARRHHGLFARLAHRRCSRCAPDACVRRSWADWA